MKIHNELLTISLYFSEEAKGILVLDHLSLPFLVSSQLKMLGPLDGNLPLDVTFQALETKDQLLCGLSL